MLEKGNKRVIRGWVFYDWANSVYNLVISSAIFPIFYDTVTTNRYGLSEDGNVYVPFWGMKVSSSVLMSFVLSASFLVVSFLSPMLSGVADYSGSKKRFLQFFCYLGAISCLTLFYFGDLPIEWGMVSVFLASIGFWNSLVFYNAYLPEIADPEDHDAISARGFSMGYFGSMLLLVICLAIILGIGPEYTKYSFLLVGLWWIGFSQITYRVLPSNVYNRKPEGRLIYKGFQELKKVFVEFKSDRVLKRFLTSFFFYNTGVQTVMLMAVLYAKREIFVGQFEEEGKTGLIISILLIQILGALGAFIISRLSGKIGNQNALLIVVSFWIPLCVMAFYIDMPNQFYGLACGVGLVMGGVQALSRSTYSKFLPDTEDHASYFSFYDVTEKVGIVFGTLFFGLMEYWTGDIRSSILSVTFFFVIGFALLWFVPRRKKNLA